jgi:isocitrate/isopropylmalate dehydrogenase
MPTYKVAVVAGDGIGPEVVASGVSIMDAAARQSGGFSIEYHDGGGHQRDSLSSGVGSPST